jgi:hypothetical protein
MPKSRQKADRTLTSPVPTKGPFVPGCIVVVTLGNPRDKFWGMILSLAPEGLSMSGIELAGFEDFVSMVKAGDQFSPAVVFLPMHRIERIELDLADGNLPSLAQRFSAKTRIEASIVLTPRHVQQLSMKTVRSNVSDGNEFGDKP